MKILFMSDEKFIRRYTPQEIFDNNEYVFVPMKTSTDDILKVCPDCDVIIFDAMANISSQLMEKMPSLKLIHSNGVGYQGVDVKYAKEKGIAVCNCKGINATAVAEHSVLFMLTLLKNTFANDERVRTGNWRKIKRGYMARGDLKELGECTVGLVGFGDIGKSLREMLKPFGADVVYYDVAKQSAETEEKYNVKYLELDQLLKVSDIVSLHVPVFDSTRNMANEEFFAKMKDGAYFINTARGELCDSTALLKRIESGKIAGAGLDCLTDEPAKLDNPIFNASQEVLKNIVFTPHTAGITGSTFKRGFKMIWENVDRLSKGEELKNIVNK